MSPLLGFDAAAVAVELFGFVIVMDVVDDAPFVVLFFVAVPVAFLAAEVLPAAAPEDDEVVVVVVVVVVVFLEPVVAFLGAVAAPAPPGPEPDEAFAFGGIAATFERRARVWCACVRACVVGGTTRTSCKLRRWSRVTRCSRRAVRRVCNLEM